ncbi:hypothetical protein EVAR_96930_1, partial [Eumeta japonica]
MEMVSAAPARAAARGAPCCVFSSPISLIQIINNSHRKIVSSPNSHRNKIRLDSYIYINKMFYDFCCRRGRSRRSLVRTAGLLTCRQTNGVLTARPAGHRQIVYTVQYEI